VRKVGPLLGEIALDFEWSAVQASDWPATYFLGHRGLDLRNYAPALLWPGVNDDPGAALPVSVARRRFPIELLAFLPFSPAPRASLPPVGKPRSLPCDRAEAGEISAGSRAANIW
jgi:hypothetical protein